MNLFKGLEKFGLKTEGTENLFEEEKGPMHQQSKGEAKEEIPSEESFLLENQCAALCAIKCSKQK